ncbi:uncharacterized protein METZ01_LOCUS507879 [marine metagenome]|uniref:Uncharacterized protein n=1 Tax=marine metagenome TaxID=408172 RepID=A0A383EFB7_9ZZZZ
MAEQRETATGLKYLWAGESFGP